MYNFLYVKYFYYILSTIFHTKITLLFSISTGRKFPPVPITYYKLSICPLSLPPLSAKIKNAKKLDKINVLLASLGLGCFKQSQLIGESNPTSTLKNSVFFKGFSDCILFPLFPKIIIPSLDLIYLVFLHHSFDYNNNASLDRRCLYAPFAPS